MRHHPAALFCFAIIVLVCALAACKKSSGGGSFPSSKKIIMVGNLQNPDGPDYAVIWENGKPRVLDSSGNALCMTISEKNVYVGGRHYRYPNNEAAYWMNGTRVTVTDTFSAEVEAIAVDGADIYLAGDYTDQSQPVVDSAFAAPVYWKNGQMIRLNGFAQGMALGIGLAGQDLFVSGYQQIGGTATGVFWKNNVLQPGHYFTQESMAVSGNDVYVLGRTDSTTWALFKNGTPTTIPDMAYGRKILVDGNDVYLTGVYGNNILGQAAIWKNNVLQTLVSGEYNSDPLGGLVIDGDDIYVSGYVGSRACYWKNGIRHDLDTVNYGAVYAMGILPD